MSSEKTFFDLLSPAELRLGPEAAGPRSDSDWEPNGPRSDSDWEPTKLAAAVSELRLKLATAALRKMNRRGDDWVPTRLKIMQPSLRQTVEIQRAAAKRAGTAARRAAAELAEQQSLEVAYLSNASIYRMRDPEEILDDQLQKINDLWERMQPKPAPPARMPVPANVVTPPIVMIEDSSPETLASNHDRGSSQTRIRAHSDKKYRDKVQHDPVLRAHRNRR
jgi:hypothetical protein